jgi:hypothetical protein
MTMERHIRTLAELRELKQRASRVGLRRVVLELPGASADVVRVEQTLNALIRSCGCDVGAVCVLTGVLVLSGLALTGQWPGLLSAGGTLFLLALVGKASGVLLREWRLRMIIDRLDSMAVTDHP